ncbi:MAG: hypothetical protein AAGN82_23320 [Myxococcota bacterium]
MTHSIVELIHLSEEDIHLLGEEIHSIGNVEFFLNGARCARLHPHSPTRIVSSNDVAWLTPGLIRDASHIGSQKRSLVHSQISLSHTDGRRVAKNSHVIWEIIKRFTTGNWWIAEPLTGELKKKSRTRAGPGAIAFFQSGGLLGSTNAHVFYASEVKP